MGRCTIRGTSEYTTGRTCIFYGMRGELLRKYTVITNGPVLVNNTWYTGVHLQNGQANLYFNGQAIQLPGHSGVATDRLGSVRSSGGQRINYYPYGGEVGAETAEGRVKFGTYTR